MYFFPRITCGLIMYFIVFVLLFQSNVYIVVSFMCQCPSYFCCAKFSPIEVYFVYICIVFFRKFCM